MAGSHDTPNHRGMALGDPTQGKECRVDTGAVVVAEVVLDDSQNGAATEMREQLKDDLLQACRSTLAAHKVPAMLRFVPTLEMTAAGKLVRPGA